MVFCWLMSALAILELAAVIVILRKMKKQQAGRVNRIIVFLIYLILLFVTIKCALFPPASEVKTTGAYDIASEDYWLVTEQKGTDGNTRELQVRAWYPANYDGEEHSAKVVVFSHGSCGTIDNNVSLFREFASHGFVVLAVAHEGQAASMVRADGKKISVDREFLTEMGNMNPQEDPEDAYLLFDKWMKVRMTDLNLVMDDFKEKAMTADTVYAKMADADRYIVAGHSLGGSAAYAMARTREDVCGCIALESPFMYDIKGVEKGEFIFDSSDYKVPLLSIYTDSSYAHLQEWKQYKNNDLFLHSDNEKYVNVYYPGVGHMGICDLSLASPFLSVMLDGIYPKVPAAKQLAILNRDCLEFVENFLSASCEESSKEQERKGIVVVATENSNYVYHMLSVAKCGYDNDYDAKTLEAMTAQAKNAEIIISIKRTTDSTLNSKQKQTVGSRPAWDVSVTSGGKNILGVGGKVTVSAPYELGTGEKARGIAVYYVDVKGSKKRCETSYDSVKKRVKWKTDHLSVYMIGYDKSGKKDKAAGNTGTVSVAKGDTLWTISRKYGCTVSEIVAANSDLIKNPNRIYLGWQLNIPQN